VIGFAALPWPETVSSGDMARVDIRRPDGLTLVSDLDHAPGGRLAFADLAQSALFGGNLRISDAGGGARLAINGSFDSITDRQWTETFTHIARAQQRYWKAKEEDFLVTVISEPAPPDRRSFGGTGLGDAFSIFALSNTGLDDITGLIAHEMMHGWIPGRIGRMPDDNEALHYWLSEGFTEWATFRVLARDGIWSPEQFAAAFNSAAAAFDTSAFREADAETMATGFWTHPDMGRLPYQKGMLIASWLDAGVREKTKGKRDLDDVLPRMQKMARKDDTALAYDLLVRAVRKVARWDVSAELEVMAMHGGAVVLPEDLFAPCGRIVVEPRPLWDRGFDFSATAAAGWKIQGVTEGSNAWDAGLRNGMELRQWSEDSRDRETMAKKTAVVTEGDGVRAITWQPVSKETREVRRLDLASGLDGAQLAACRKRLGGT
jgi:predicted metalloprotease with PDZ domain